MNEEKTKKELLLLAEIIEDQPEAVHLLEPVTSGELGELIEAIEKASVN